MLTLSLAAKTVCVVLAAQSAKPSTIDKSIALLGDALRPTGVAVLIDNRGYFLAANQNRIGKTVEAILSDGTKVLLTFVSSDEISQLTLLLAGDWKPEMGTPTRIMQSNQLKSERLTLVNGTSRIQGELVLGSKIGILADSGRYVPLNEMRFEFQSKATGGAPVFNSMGELAGFVNASVGNVSSPKTMGEESALGSPKLGIQGESTRNYGPQGLVVSYSFNEKVLGRVIDGFLGEDHQPKHPYLGVFYQNHLKGGVEIRTITKSSPSEDAGLKVGDIIQSVNDNKVTDSFVLAARIFEMSVGDIAEMQIIRSNITMNIEVIVGQVSVSKGNSSIPNFADLERDYRVTSKNVFGDKNRLSLNSIIEYSNSLSQR